MNSDSVDDTRCSIWLYDKTADNNQINEIRYKLFAQKKFLFWKSTTNRKYTYPTHQASFLSDIYLEKRNTFYD